MPGNGIACVFACQSQLELMASSTDIWIDATFQTVPSLFMQLLGVHVVVDGCTFPCCYALMTRKTTELYAAVFQKLHELLPGYCPASVTADYEAASVNGLTSVWGDSVSVKGCWFHFAQAVVKKSRSIGLSRQYRNSELVKKCIRCVISLPLLPANDITTAIGDLETTYSTGEDAATLGLLRQLLNYVRRQWIEKSSVGPSRISVFESTYRTNNGVEAFHASLKRRVRISHPNLHVFLRHLGQATIDSLADLQRLRNGLRIRRHKRKKYEQNDERISRQMARFSAGNMSRLEFLNAVSHTADNVADALATEDDDDTEVYSIDGESAEEDNASGPGNSPLSPAPPPSVAIQPDVQCDVCLVNARDPIVLVPCGHARFCRSCADRLVLIGLHCPICRTAIQSIMSYFS